MATYDLGKVVGDPGEKGDDGSSVWNTSTAPTYANSKYTFTISNLNGKTGIDIAVNDIIFYSTYYYIVSTVNSTTVDCTTRVSIKGSDASVTIVDNLTSDSSTSALSAKQGKALNTNKIATSAIATSWGSTTSDSKVPSEKLAKDTLDGKQATLVSGTNIKTINNNSLLGSGNIDIQSSSVDIATSWGSTLSDTKVPSEKLTKNSLDAKADSSSLATVATTGDYDDLTDKPTIPSDVSDLTDSTGIIPTDVSDLTDTNNTTFTPKSHTHGNITNDGKVGSNANYFVYTTTGGAVTSKQKIGNITTSGKIGSTSGLPIKTGSSGTLEAGSFGTTSGTFAEGNHTHSGYVSATKVTSWSSTVSDSNVPSEKLVKDSLDAKADSSSLATVATTGDYDDLSDKPTIPSKISELTNDSDFIETSSTSGVIANDGSVIGIGTTQGTVAAGNHTHSNYISGTKVTSWSSTVSDSNIPSEKLVKDTLDTKQATLVSGTSIKTINNESLLGSGNITIQGGSNVDVVTSWESTLSDSKVPSEKLVKNSLDDKLGTSIGTSSGRILTTGTNGVIQASQTIEDGKINALNNSYTQVQNVVTQEDFNLEADSLLGNKVDKVSGKGLSTNDFTSTYKGYVDDLVDSTKTIKNGHTHSEYVSATKVTSWSSTVSDSNVPSEKLVKDYVDGLVGSAIQYIVGSGS